MVGPMKDAFEPLNRTALPALAVNAHGRIVSWNQGAAEFFHRSANGVVGTEWHSIVRTVESEGCCPLCNTRRFIRSGQATVPEQVTLSVDGYHQHVTVIPVPMNDEVIGFLVLAQELLGATSAGAAPIPIHSRVRNLGDDRIIENLTARERDILSCVVDGYDARTIAARLGISHATARNYVQRILTKLGARNKAEAVSVALTYNLLAS